MLRMSVPRHPPFRNRRQRRIQLVVVRRFQYRYAFFLACCGFMAAGITGGLALFLLNYNYNLFIRTELITSPRVVDHLYRELKLANELIGSALLGFVAFLTMIGIKFSHRIVVPIYLIQEKMRQICRGNLKDADITLRRTDEFQEFGETYNYLVATLKSQLKNDLDRLKSLKPNGHNRDAVHTWEQLVEEKQAQLNGLEFGSPAKSASERHAS